MLPWNGCKAPASQRRRLSKNNSFIEVLCVDGDSWTCSAEPVSLEEGSFDLRCKIFKSFLVGRELPNVYPDGGGFSGCLSALLTLITLPGFWLTHRHQRTTDMHRIKTWINTSIVQHLVALSLWTLSPGGTDDILCCSSTHETCSIVVH